jgi:hypothetical protein
MIEASAAVNGNYNGGADASPDRTMAASPKPPLRKRRRFRVSIVPYLFLAPFLLVFAAFLVAPLVYALYTSVFRDMLVGGRRFVGFANYLRVAVDSDFWGGVSNLLFFGATQVPIMLSLALTLAIVLDRGALHARGLFRLGFFIPYAWWPRLFGDTSTAPRSAPSLSSPEGWGCRRRTSSPTAPCCSPSPIS